MDFGGTTSTQTPLTSIGIRVEKPAHQGLLGSQSREMGFLQPLGPESSLEMVTPDCCRVTQNMSSFGGCEGWTYAFISVFLGEEFLDHKVSLYLPC